MNNITRKIKRYVLHERAFNLLLALHWRQMILLWAAGRGNWQLWTWESKEALKSLKWDSEWTQTHQNDTTARKFIFSFYKFFSEKCFVSVMLIAWNFFSLLYDRVAALKSPFQKGLAIFILPYGNSMCFFSSWNLIISHTCHIFCEVNYDGVRHQIIALYEELYI